MDGGSDVGEGSSGATRSKQVPLFQSDSDSSSSTVGKEVPFKKKKAQPISWLFDKKFENSNDAEEAVKKENAWSTDYSRNTEEGKKKFYRCNKVKKRGPQCSAKLYLLFDCTSNSVLLYRADADHDHGNKANTSIYGLSEAVKLEINKLFDLNMKPRAIMSCLTKIEGIKMPKISQLRNYLNDRRRAKYGNHTISLGELEGWLLTHSVVPDDLHQVFVVSYELIENDIAPAFRFAISTRYLLEMARDANIFHADATYKLIWQGYPVLVVGTTDKDRKFHAFCLAVATNEQKEDFKMVFNALKDKVHVLFSVVLKPAVLVCDAAKSIQNAFLEVFGDEVIVRMCWAHAKKKIQSRVESSIKNKLVQKDLLADIDTLHCITCPNIFNAASEYFLHKYQDQKEFVDYFKKQWLVQNRNWYLGAAPSSPSTNNALESFNRVIKDSNTLRGRLPLSRFLVIATDMVGQWSTKYLTPPEDSVFAKTPTVTLKVWTQSYNWAKLPKEVTELHNDGNYITYNVPAGEAEVCIDFKKQWENFNELKEQYFSRWKVSLPINKEEWKLGKCNCPTFYKMYMCKHIIGLAIRLKLTIPPVEAKNLPLGEKRKRGRPSKAKRALIIQ